MRQKIGWGLLVVGTIVEYLSHAAQTDASLANVNLDQTTTGSFLAPIQKILPVPLGFGMIGAGAILLFFEYRKG